MESAGFPGGVSRCPRGFPVQRFAAPVRSGGVGFAGQVFGQRVAVGELQTGSLGLPTTSVAELRAVTRKQVLIPPEASAGRWAADPHCAFRGEREDGHQPAARRRCPRRGERSPLASSEKRQGRCFYCGLVGHVIIVAPLRLFRHFCC